MLCLFRIPVKILGDLSLDRKVTKRVNDKTITINSNSQDRGSYSPVEWNESESRKGFIVLKHKVHSDSQPHKVRVGVDGLSARLPTLVNAKLHFGSYAGRDFLTPLSLLPNDELTTTINQNRPPSHSTQRNAFTISSFLRFSSASSRFIAPGSASARFPRCLLYFLTTYNVLTASICWTHHSCHLPPATPTSQTRGSLALGLSPSLIQRYLDPVARVNLAASVATLLAA